MLFNKNEIIINNESNINDNADSFINIIPSNKKTYSIKDKTNLSNCISDLSKEIEVISDGAFSMHQLVNHIIKLINNPCKLYVTTWAMSEKIVSTLITLKHKGLIEDCYFLFDHRVKRYRPNAYALINQNFQCKITSIHAKICVIESKDIIVRILGSGNWTRNDKIEVYSISPNKEVCDFYKNFIINELEDIK